MMLYTHKGINEGKQRMEKVSKNFKTFCLFSTKGKTTPDELFLTYENSQLYR